MSRVYQLRCELATSVSLREAFELFQDPYHLRELFPDWLQLQVMNETPVVMRRGAEIDYRMRWMGVPLSWRTRITEYEPPFYFADEALRGPFAMWRHWHTFRPSAEGTVVIDAIEYAMPFGVLGEVTHSACVGRQLQRMFAHRQRTAMALLGGRQEPLVLGASR